MAEYLLCIAVRLSSGERKMYERPLTTLDLGSAIRVTRISLAYMRKRLEIEGSPTKVLGGWIRRG